MVRAIAVVAAACEYPDSRSPKELWETSLFGRQAFRRFPSSRLAIAQYARGDDDPDSIYEIEACLIKDYVFDRERFLVPLATYRGTDLAHWLSLDVADRAISSMPPGAFGKSHLKDRTGVIIANTLTGEFSRAALIRYRWPYIEHQVRRSVASRLAGTEVERFLAELEQQIKLPFPEPDSDSLAGGLSNTIAGRIANHFGLRGGSHAVDGACASSLVGIVTACDRLRSGDLDCAVVGAVDLSLDPFELVGFARNGALARQDMRVFDRDSEGFWPSEGCGVVVLATEELAAEMNWPVLGWIRGTGLSGDGHGGLTRPTSGGQLLALQRAWAMSGADAAHADYFEAHGTGTPTGDPIEIRALAGLLAGRHVKRPVPVGSVKTNIGHTKAAAGLAGLIKALSISEHRVVPPTAGHQNAHDVMIEDGVRDLLRVPAAPEAVDHDRPMWIGVNSFGFGGINCHVVVQGPTAVPGRRSSAPTVAGTGLRGELIAMSASSRDQLVAQIEQLRRVAATLSRGEMVDLAAAHRPSDERTWRACIVAAVPKDLEGQATALLVSLGSGGDGDRSAGGGWAWSAPMVHAPRLAYLFSGQAAITRVDAKPWVERFPRLDESASRLSTEDASGTAGLQPLLAEIAIASVDLLRRLGLEPHAVIGHSFGELSALYTARAIDQSSFRALACCRGKAMSELSPPGAMLAVEIDRPAAQKLANRFSVDVACHNALDRHVFAGTPNAIEELARACEHDGYALNRLPTERAFHSQLMQKAQSKFSVELAALAITTPTIPVASTITGRLLEGEPLCDLLATQFTAPVLFDDAIRALGQIDLLVELGGGAGLSGLVEHLDGPACLPVPVFGSSLEPLLSAIGAWWVCGGQVDTGVLYENRLVRPFVLQSTPSFFSSPCAVDVDSDVVKQSPRLVRSPAEPTQHNVHSAPESIGAFDLLQSLICEVADLPRRAVNTDSKLLSDLHLNSLRARHVIATAARRLCILHLPFNLGDIATATVGEVASQLEHLRSEQLPDATSTSPNTPGIEPWLAVLSHRWKESNEAEPAIAGRRFWVASSSASLPAAIADLATEATDAPQLLYLPNDASESVLERLLGAARLAERGLLIVQGGQLANGFAQSLAKEYPSARVCVVEVQCCDTESLSRATAEFDRLPRGYSELRLLRHHAQSRSVAVHPLTYAAPHRPISAADVVLVTGGAKGIGAATARFLAKNYGCRLALVGRSLPEDSKVLATLLALETIAPKCVYVQADLTDPDEARRVIEIVQGNLGPVTMLVHSAGLNIPVSARDLTSRQLTDTVAAKVLSMEHLLEVLPASQLKILVSFSSIIGELGLPGEAHYALANEWLTNRTLAYAQRSPCTRCLPIAWSAWREVGMAAQMEGVLDQLARADTRPLETAEALEALQSILESRHHGEAVIVAGRYGRGIDAFADLPILQRHRYLESPRVYYPGIELVAEAEVSTDTDRYLIDHAPFGVPVFPLVAAIEAMLSAASTLQSTSVIPVIQDLRIGDAVTLSLGEQIVLRTSAHRRPDGSVVANIRSSRTAFEADHFGACFRWSESRAASELKLTPAVGALSASSLIYDGLCFHGPQFHKVTGYYEVGALGCLAGLGTCSSADWFGRFQPRTLLAGEPTVRDAILHSLQACIPQHTVLPVGADLIELGTLHSDTVYFVSARQTSGDGHHFRFNVEVFDAQGMVIERWTGLRLARVMSEGTDLSSRRKIDTALLEPFAGRLLLDELEESDWSVGVWPQAVAGSSEQAVQRALGPDAVLAHDPSGRPQVRGRQISITHTDELTMAVTHKFKPVSCDIEHQAAIDLDVWPLMLGDRRWAFAEGLERVASISRETAALVVWTAAECLSKMGRPDWPFDVGAIMSSIAVNTGPVVKLTSDGVRIAVGVVQFHGHLQPSAIAVGVLDAEPESHICNRGSDAVASMMVD